MLVKRTTNVLEVLSAPSSR